MLECSTHRFPEKILEISQARPPAFCLVFPSEVAEYLTQQQALCSWGRPQSTVQHGFWQVSPKPVSFWRHVGQAENEKKYGEALERHSKAEPPFLAVLEVSLWWLLACLIVFAQAEEFRNDRLKDRLKDFKAKARTYC